MSNMSYCRFQNTLGDLKDCRDNIHETKDMSKEERSARDRLVQVCKEIVEEYYNGKRD